MANAATADNSAPLGISDTYDSELAELQKTVFALQEEVRSALRQVEVRDAIIDSLGQNLVRLQQGPFAV